MPEGNEDLASKTPEQLEQMMAELVNPPSPPEGPASETVDTAAEESVSDVATQETPEPEPVPAPSLDLEDLKLTLQEEAIRRQKLEEQLKHERILRDRQASQAGYYKKVAIDLARETHRAPEREPESEYPVEEPSPAVSKFQRDIDLLKEDAVNRSANDAINKFYSEHPDFNEMMAEITENVKKARDEYSYWFETGDPKIIRQTTELVLKQAYLEAKASKIAKAREEAQSRRAQQMEAMTKAKRATVISGSGSSPAPKSKPKAIEEMSVEEIDAELRRLARG